MNRFVLRARLLINRLRARARAPAFPLALVALLTAPGAGALTPVQPLMVFPERVAPGAAFLLLVQDTWPDSCGGEVTATVAPDLIEITATAAMPPPSVVCSDVLTPFRRIVNPRAIALGVDFGERVRVRYRYTLGAGFETVDTREITFDGPEPVASPVQSGGWATPALARSGLFVDQQGRIFSAMLADYGPGGTGRWYYAAGAMEGPVFSAPMVSYRRGACDPPSCDRAEPDRTGRVDVIVADRDALYVQYAGVLAEPEAEREAFAYRRLRFERSPVLAGLALAVPDLEGEWVAGVRALPERPGAYRPVAIGFDRVEQPDGAIPAYVFRATPVGPTPAGAADGAFEIACRDARPVDGPVACEVLGFVTDFGLCTASFSFDAVGYARVSAPASCDETPFSDRTFDLFRLD